MRRFKLLTGLIAVIAAAVLLSSAFTTGAGGNFPDINEGDWYYSAVTRLYNSGVVNGYDDGYFYPNETLTAAQFIKMLFYDTDIPYTEGEEWWRPYYQAGVEAGIIDETILTEAAMDYPLNRYQTAQLISSLGVVSSAPEGFKAVPDTALIRSAIADLSSMPPDYMNAVMDVFALGIMKGYDDGYFHGDDSLTRAMAAQIIMRLYDESQRTPVCNYISVDDLPVGDEWFEDALIIGNSLAGGLAQYGGLKAATIFYCNGVSVYGIYNADFTRQDGAAMSIGEALNSGSFTKVILIFGTNEMMSDAGCFYDSYCAFIDEIRKYQPGADIYIHNTPPVNELMVAYPDSFNNGNVLKANEVIGKVASDKGLTVVDIYTLFADAYGELPSEATFDGVHFNTSYYKSWADFLRTAVN
jgi:hypothetical protein